MNNTHDPASPEPQGYRLPEHLRNAATIIGNVADSAGQPWEGREFQETSPDFADDDGSMPETVRTGFDQFTNSQISFVELVQILAVHRVLIPLLAVAGDIGYTDSGMQVDKTQELSIVTVEAPDGRHVLPVFTDVAAMQRWRQDARPVPVSMVKAALAAVDDGSDLIVVNPGSDEEIILRRPAVWAIAQEKTGEWKPAYEDEEVLNEFAALSQNEPALYGLRLVNADPQHRLAGPETAIVLAIQPGLSQTELAETVQRLQTAWSDSTLIRERVDSMTIKLVAAEGVE